MSIKDTLEKYHLQAERIEDGVYKVLNENITDITGFLQDLENGSGITVITNVEVRKHGDGYGYRYAGILYVFESSVTEEKMWKYENLAFEHYPSAQNFYVEESKDTEGIDTLYSLID